MCTILNHRKKAEHSWLIRGKHTENLNLFNEFSKYETPGPK